MPIPSADRVQAVKWESTSQGGGSDEPFPEGINEIEDALSARGMYFQNTTAVDQECYSHRDASTNELKFKDSSNKEQSLSQLVKVPKFHLDGFLISKLNSNELTVGEGVCRSDDDTINIELASSSTVNLNSSGVNGLDVSTKAIETWYHVFAIYNPTTDTTALLFSLSPTAPTLPSGYTKKRKIGVWYNDTSSSLRSMKLIHSSGRIRRYSYGTSLSILETTVLTNGQALTWSDLDISDFVPATSKCTFAYIYHHGELDTNYTDIRVSGSSITQSIYRQYGGQEKNKGAASSSSELMIFNDGVQTLQYQNSNLDCFTSFWIEGFSEEL